MCNALQMYYVTIKAETSAGSIAITSDGVMVVTPDSVINEITINDGQTCTLIGKNYYKRRTDMHFDR